MVTKDSGKAIGCSDPEAFPSTDGQRSACPCGQTPSSTGDDLAFPRFLIAFKGSLGIRGFASFLFAKGRCFQFICMLDSLIMRMQSHHGSLPAETPLDASPPTSSRELWRSNQVTSFGWVPSVQPLCSNNFRRHAQTLRKLQACRQLNS